MLWYIRHESCDFSFFKDKPLKECLNFVLTNLTWDVTSCNCDSSFAVSSWVTGLFGLSWSSEVPCRKSQHEHPAASLRRVWASISSSACALWGCRQGLLGGLEEEEGVYSQPPQQFYFSETSRLAFVLHSSSYPLSCSLGSFIITRYIYQGFSAVPARPPLFSHLLLLHSPFGANVNLCNRSVGDPVRGRAPWCQVGWLCVYLLLGMIGRAVWRRVATEWSCLWSKRVNGDRSTLLPSHPHSPYPDKGKPLSGSDGARLLWGSPPLHSFSLPDSLFPLPLSLSVWRRIA